MGAEDDVDSDHVTTYETEEIEQGIMPSEDGVS